MKTKRVFSALCAAAVLVSSLAAEIAYSAADGVYADEMSAEKTEDEMPAEEAEEETGLPVPQNLRYEDGDIVWDRAFVTVTVNGEEKQTEVYGYTLYVSSAEGYSGEFTYYENRVELDRFCYENGLDFGEYKFEVCAFQRDESTSERSNSVTAEYAPTLDAPSNVRLSEENKGYIEWDGVENVYRYYIRIYKNDADHTLYYDRETFRDETDYWYSWIDSGDYLISVRAIDRDYNATKWSEPIPVTVEELLDAVPQNLRYEDGYLVWDKAYVTVTADGEQKQEEVYGYELQVYYTYAHGDNDVPMHGDRFIYGENRVELDRFCYDNEISSGEYEFRVRAFQSDGQKSEWSNPVTAKYDRPTLDAPANVRLSENGNAIEWDEVEGAEYYQVNIHIWITDESGRSSFLPDVYSCEEPCWTEWHSFVSPFPNTEYDITVAAYGDEGKIRSASSEFHPSFEMTLDESITVPDVQLGDLQWSNGTLQWNNVEGADAYWLTISADGCLCNGNGDYHTRYAANRDSYNWENYYLPFGTYDVNLFVVDKHSYNKKTYSLTFGAISDETIWTPEPKCKFDEILWDYDQVRHDDTSFFWVCITDEKTGKTVMLEKTWSEYFYGHSELPDGSYTVEVCALTWFDWPCKIGPWGKVNIVKRGESVFASENEIIGEIEPSPDAEDIPDEERITEISINPALNIRYKDNENMAIDLTLFAIEAKEIYDEEGLQRASEALGKTISGDRHYNLLDLTLLYNGEDFSNSYEGLVKVTMKLPERFKDKNFSCYRIVWDNEQKRFVKEKIDGEQTEDSYIIYLEHFSEYALVADPNEEEEHNHIFSEEWTIDETNHWKECECGEKSEEAEHAYGDWTVTAEATETEEGARERACEICGFKESEMIPALPHTHIYGGSWITDENGHHKECECGEKSTTGAHAYSDWTIIKKATETEEGARERACEVCGFKQTEGLPKLAPVAPPETEKPDDKTDDPNTGVAAVEAYAAALPICCAAIAFVSKKRRSK